MGGHACEEEHHRQRQVGKVCCVPWHQDHDRGWSEEDRSCQEQDGENREPQTEPAGKKAYARIRGWTAAVIKARKFLNVKGFVAVKRGTPLYNKAKEFYKTK